MLPLYWASTTRHFLWCRVFKQIGIHGSFWAHNLLNFERVHVFLKSCCRSSKNLLQSVKNNYDIHCALQAWQFQNDWVNGSFLRSSLAHRLSGAHELQVTCGAVELLHAKKWRPVTSVLTSGLFEQVQDIWAIHDPTYGRLKDRYARAMNRTDNKVSIADWEAVATGRHLTTEEKKMKSMTADIKVCIYLPFVLVFLRFITRFYLLLYTIFYVLYSIVYVLYLYVYNYLTCTFIYVLYCLFYVS